MTEHQAQRERTERYATLAVVFLCTSVAYLATVDRGIDLADYGDFQTVPYLLGIAYPPGFPGYVLLGYVWSHALPIGSVALRMNLLSVVAAAAANGFLAAALLQIGVGAGTALVAAVLWGLSYETWTHAGAASAHVVGTAFVVAMVLTTLRWTRTGDARMLTATCVACGMSLACDLTAVLAVPGLAVIASSRRCSVRAGFSSVVLGAIVLTALYAYLPLRSEYVSQHGLDPTTALGFDGHDQFLDQDHPATLRNFVHLVTGANSGASRGFATMFLPGDILRALDDFVWHVSHELGPLATVVAIISLIVFVRDQRRIAVGITLVSLLPALYLSAWGAESDAGRYLPRETLVIVFALAWGYARISAVRSAFRFPLRVLFIVVAVSVVVLYTIHIPRLAADRSRRDAGAVALLASSVPAQSFIVAPFAYGPPLEYFAKVDGRIPGAVVLCCNVEELLQEMPLVRLRGPLLVLDDVQPTTAVFALQRVRSEGGVTLWRALPRREQR